MGKTNGIKRQLVVGHLAQAPVARLCKQRKSTQRGERQSGASILQAGRLVASARS